MDSPIYGEQKQSGDKDALVQQKPLILTGSYPKRLREMASRLHPGDTDRGMLEAAAAAIDRHADEIEVMRNQARGAHHQADELRKRIDHLRFVVNAIIAV